MRIQLIRVEKKMTKRAIHSLKIDRTAFEVTSLQAPSDEPAYWKSQPPAKRWEAMELMRQINYGHAATGRLQRVLEVAQLQKG
jgi:hypothetical protein